MKILLAHNQEKLKEILINAHKNLARDYLFHKNIDFNTFKIIEDTLLNVECMVLPSVDVSEILDIKEDYYRGLIRSIMKVKIKFAGAQQK